MVRLLTSALFLAITGAALADGHFERTLNVSGPTDVYVSTGSGSIRVHPGSDSQVRISAQVHAGWNFGRDGEDRIRQIVANPPVTQSGNTIRIGDSNDHNWFNNITIDYDITAPASVALNLRSGSGDVEVDHLGRFLAATSGSGSVRAHGLRGPATLQSGSGDIELQQDAGGDVKATTGSGSIRINGFSGGISARTGSGDIEANGRLTGAAKLSSGSGSVRMNLTPDAHFDLQASTGSGSIRVNFPNAPRQDDENRHHLTGAVNGGGPALEARTGSGDIEINSGYRN